MEPDGAVDTNHVAHVLIPQPTGTGEVRHGCADVKPFMVPNGVRSLLRALTGMEIERSAR